jgi:hypothetical protein
MHNVLTFLKKWWLIFVCNLMIVGMAIYAHYYTFLAYYIGWLLAGWCFRFAILYIVAPRVNAFIRRQAAREAEKEQAN